MLKPVNQLTGEVNLRQQRRALPKPGFIQRYALELNWTQVRFQNLLNSASILLFPLFAKLGSA